MDQRRELNTNTATNGENSNTTKKPSFRKPPVVKQTLTSMYRIAKANPLMLIRNDKSEGNSDDFGVNKIKLPKSIFQPTATHTAKEQCIAAPVSKKPATESTQSTNSNKSEPKKIALTRTTSLRTAKTKMPCDKLALQRADAVKHQSRALDNKKNSKIAVSNPQPRSTKRRSLSAEHYDHQRKLIQVKIEQVLDKNSTQSLSSIQKEFAANLPNVSSIVEEKRVTHKASIAYMRRSVSVYTPTSYHRPILGASSSYEDLKISPQPVADETPKAGSSGGNSREVARAALDDLHKLIIEGYSREQCKAWLETIRHNYQYLEKEHQYWECRAAIEQSRGNIISAVECLQAAIIQGAEVGAVNHSLEQLLEKFSLLNISTSESLAEEDRKKRDRARIVLDARNVFKSSIIQFAVQEQTLKKKQSEEQPTEKRFLITPVRRSTRTSRSGYTSTPGVHMCSSLQEFDKSDEHIFDFRSNNALSNI